VVITLLLTGYGPQVHPCAYSYACSD
jgi:hypothetical protein